MISKNALDRAIAHPMFTARAALQYVKMHKEIQQIKQKLKSHFNSEDIENFSTGASAGIKEIALYLVVKDAKPDLIIETGVAQGISTYFILKALKENGKGKLISIDLPNHKKGGYTMPDGTNDAVYIPEGLESGWIVPDELRGNWRLLIGKSSDKLPELENEKFDMFIHDSEHSYENMSFELDWALKHMDKGLIVVDDSERNNALNDFISKNSKRVNKINNPLSIVAVR